jgi:pimeloyl-ACP methyl ester carboxylesterase
MSIELAFETIAGAHPERSIVLLHGILGRGSNLKTIAKRFVEARPDWAACLADLRGHGQSPKGTPGPSLEACAGDVVDLARRTPKPVHAMLGHSFGGKVALEAVRIGGIPSLEHVFVIDSAPGVRAPRREGDSALAVIAALESLPPTFPSKTAFIEAVVAAGLTSDIAKWLAGSTERVGDRVRFMLDLDEIRTLVRDYAQRDLWPVVEQPPEAVDLHLVIGGRSTVYSQADREGALRIASSNRCVTVDVLPAGHWVHVDNPNGLLRKLLEYLE